MFGDSCTSWYVTDKMRLCASGTSGRKECFNASRFRCNLGLLFYMWPLALFCSSCLCLFTHYLSLSLIHVFLHLSKSFSLCLSPNPQLPFSALSHTLLCPFFCSLSLDCFPSLWTHTLFTFPVHISLMQPTTLCLCLCLCLSLFFSLPHPQIQFSPCPSCLSSNIIFVSY